MIIHFDKPQAYDLATKLLGQGFQPQSYQANAAELAIDLDDDTLGSILSQIAHDSAAVLPILGQELDQWLLCGTSRHVVDRAFAHVARFILPSYAELSGGSSFAVFQSFLPGVSPVCDAAGKIYSGYYTWQSPPGNRSVILRKLALWIQLDKQHPVFEPLRQPSYAEVLVQFNSALAALNWSGAVGALAQMQQLHLCTADNLMFLRIQLLAHQGHWKNIWEDQNYSRLATMYIPRTVRSALIIGFHHSALLEHEKDRKIEQALALFKQATPKLGNLLSGRFDLSDSAVIRVFGYQAVLAQDRPALEELMRLEYLDTPARTCLELLIQLLPPQLSPALPPSQRLRRAMNDRDYDIAVQAACELPLLVERTQALLRIAVLHQDAAKDALRAYESLSGQEQIQLETEEPAVNFYLERILEISKSKPLGSPLQTWHDWFQKLFMAPEDKLLQDATDNLATDTDERDWTPDSIRTLTRDLEKLFGDFSDLLKRKHVGRAMNILIDRFLADDNFPNSGEDYNALYHDLYNCLILMDEVKDDSTVKLLRLVDSVLRANPDQLEMMLADLQEWFAHPTPSLEDRLLDTFELLVTHGATRSQLAELYRHWLAYRLDLPIAVTWERTSQEVWLSFGEWIQPGDDLLGPLRERLEVPVHELEDPIAKLPDDFRLTIFTLDRPSAERVRGLLLRRNPKLDIRFCHETDLNPQVEALARNCDVAVVVTTCISHAITYGISPLLHRDPIYPASRGSTSIIRAIEEYAGHFLGT